MGRLTRYAAHGAKIAVGKRSNLPSYIILFVTSKCNSRCRHCFFWKDLNAQKNELTLEEIRKLSSDLGEVSNLAVSGGEPTLRTDLPEICELFHKNNKTNNIHIPTNGLSPNLIKSKIKEVLEKCDCRITVAISLDGLKETHDNIRGVKDNFESVLETYKELLDLKKNHKNLKLMVNTVISNKNYKEVVKLINFVKTNMPELDGHGFDWIRGNPKDKEFGIPSLDEIKELLPMLKKTEETYLNKRKNLRDRLELGIRHYLSDLKYEIIKSNKQVIPCRAGDIFAVVYPQGDVALCELLPMIGNLREQDIKTVWNSEKAESQRQHIKDKKCHCTHGCFQPTNVMLYPKAYPKILKKLITN